MTREAKLDLAKEKLQQLLDLAPEEDQEKARVELSKMVPENENASVESKIGWGYYDNLIQSGSTFKVSPCSNNISENDLFNLYSKLIELSNNDISEFIDAFDIILSEKPNKISIGVIPAFKISEKTFVITINLKVRL